MLSITSQYALRALSHLARQSDGSVLGRELSQSVEIPANYLSKVLLVLRNAGLVDTTRGSGGGYRLGRPASEIRLIDVVELFEKFPERNYRVSWAARVPVRIPSLALHMPLGKGLQASYLGFLVSTPLSAIAGNPGDIWTSSEPGRLATKHHRPEGPTHTGG